MGQGVNAGALGSWCVEGHTVNEGQLEASFVLVLEQLWITSA